MKYFEDLSEGTRIEHGTRTVTRDEIIRFARKWDPQPFHVDERTASESIFGELIASGLHTLCICNILAHEGLIRDVAIVVGQGIDRLRFPNPVYPNDRLSVRVEVISKNPSIGPPESGLVKFENKGYTNHEEMVLSYVTLAYVQHRSKS